MALDDLMAALNAGSKNAKERNGYFTARDALSGFQFQPSRKERETGKTDWKKQLMGMMGVGLLGGVLEGLGQKRQTEQNQASSARLFTALNSPDPAMALAADPEYSQLAPALQIEAMRNKQALAAKQAEKAMEFGYQQLGSGRIFDPSTGQFSAAPGYAQTEAYNTLIPEGMKQEQNYQLQSKYEPGIAAAKEAATRQAGLQFLGAEEAIKAAGSMRGELTNPLKVLERSDALRKELSGTPEHKEFSAVSTGYRALIQALNDKSPVADQELVRRAIQMIEPGMAVREGEQAAVAASQSLPQYWKGAMLKALNGEAQLGPELRQGIASIADRAYSSQLDRYQTVVNKYREQAQLRNADPNAVSFLPLRTPEQVRQEVRIPTGQPTTKVMNGITYIKVNGGWAPQG